MQNDNFQFLGAYGDVSYVVRVNLCRDDTYDLLVNKHLVGRIMKIDGQWIGDFHNNADYTAADVLIIADMIENKVW